jgi:ABC-type sugar transport system permease subunit
MKRKNVIVAAIGLISIMVVGILVVFYVVDIKAILCSNNQTDGSIIAEAFFTNLWISIPVIAITIFSFKFKKERVFVVNKFFELLSNIPTPKFLK